MTSRRHRPSWLAFCLIGFFTLALAAGAGQADAAQSERFGFVSDSWDRDPTLSAEPFTRLGLGWDRPHAGPFSWNDIEPVAGSYDFSQTDAYLSQIQPLGVRVMATIWPFTEWDQAYWQAQPGWEAAAGFEEELPLSRYKPHDTAAYQRFVGALVERYDGDGTDDMPGLTQPIKHWEVLNEPETADWVGLCFFKGSASDYLEVLAASHQAIMGADAEAIIFNGGSTGVSPPTFWQELLSLGGSQYFSVGNTHSITPGPEVDDLGAGEWAALLAPYNITTFWVSEVQIPYGNIHGLYTSPEEQASRLAKGYLKAFAQGAGAIFWTVWQAQPGNDQSFIGAALLDVNGEKTLAHYALETMIGLLGDFSAVETITEGQYRFETGGGSVYALWGSGGGPAELSGPVRVTSHLGQTSQMDAAGLVLSEDPIFVEGLGQ